MELVKEKQKNMQMILIYGYTYRFVYNFGFLNVLLFITVLAKRNYNMKLFLVLLDLHICEQKL